MQLFLHISACPFLLDTEYLTADKGSDKAIMVMCRC